MAKVDPTKHGSSRPKLSPDDLEEEVAILEITSFEEAEIEDADRPEGKRWIAMLYFEETGDKALFLNKTQIQYLIEGLGSDDSEDWIGQPVPVEVKRGRFQNQPYEKVYIVDPLEWSDYIELEPKPAKSKPKPKKKTAKKKK